MLLLNSRRTILKSVKITLELDVECVDNSDAELLQENMCDLLMDEFQCIRGVLSSSEEGL